MPLQSTQEKMNMIRTYSELVLLPTFIERFNYLKLNGTVGSETFGYDRVLNQIFYKTKEWKQIRRDLILRDNGCDLGILDREIPGRILIHHMNPINEDDIKNRSEMLLNPEYLICVSHNTHNAIHYGDENLLIKKPTVRFSGDTCLWKG